MNVIIEITIIQAIKTLGSLQSFLIISILIEILELPLLNFQFLIFMV